MTNQEKDFITEKMIGSDKIRKIYDDYIIKTIPYEEWVRNTVEALMTPNTYDADVLLKELMQ